MTDFVDLLPFPWNIVAVLLFLVVAVVAFFVTLFTKRDVSKAIKEFKEIIDLKNKYQTVDKRVRPSQSFSEEVDDYFLNAQSNELEKSPVPKNIQDVINSHVDTALERALERFSVPNVIDDNDGINDYVEKVNDLSSIGLAMEKAEQYREAFHLPDSASISDIYKAIDDKALELKQSLLVKKGKESDDVEKKEVK